jgi:O-antigen ligase
MAISPSLAWIQLLDYLKVIVIFIVMVNTVRTPGRLKALLLLIFGITVLLSVTAVKDYMTGNFAVQGIRIKGIIGGMFSNPNDLALHLVTMIPIALSLAFRSGGIFARCLYFVVALSIIAGVIATFSRAGFLGLVVTLGVLTWRLARSNRGLLVFGLLGMLLLAPLIAGYSRRFTTNEGSAINRMDDLKRSVNVALHHPLVGIGMNNYRFYSNNNQASHNAYTQVWVEMGFAALPLYVALLIAPLRGLRKAGRTSADGKRSGNAFLAIGLEVSIYGYMVCSFFASVAYLWYAYYLIAFSICLRRLSSTASASSTPPDFQEPADSIAYYDRENPSQSIS